MIPAKTHNADLVMTTPGTAAREATLQSADGVLGRALSAIRSVAPRPLILSIADQCLVSGTSFVTMVAVGRACGFHELGIYALAVSIVVTLMGIQESLLIAPFTVIMWRFRIPQRRNKYFAATLQQQLLFGGAACLAVFVLGAVAGLLFVGRQHLSLVTVLALVTPVWLLREYARRVSFVEFHTRLPIVLDGLAASVQLFTLLVMWKSATISAPLALGAIGLGNFTAIAAWWVVRRPPLLAGRSLLQRAARLNWGLGRWSCVGRATEMLHAYGLHWLLALVAGPTATGAYAAASSLLALSNPILMGIGNMLAPETARAYAAEGISALRQVVYRASWLVTVFTALFALILACTAEPLLRLTFEHAHERQTMVVGILSLGMLLGMIGFGADNGLRALARPDRNFVAALAGLIVTMLSAAFLIGRWEAVGAALAMAAGNLIASLIRIGSFVQILRRRGEVTASIAYRGG